MMENEIEFIENYNAVAFDIICLSLGGSKIW
jgi:hypothetical protein